MLPGHEISTDREIWQPAVSAAFLDMRWFIDDGDGDLKGPLNRKAAETLIRNGKFSAKAVILSADEAEKSLADSTLPERQDGESTELMPAEAEADEPDDGGRSAVDEGGAEPHRKKETPERAAAAGAADNTAGPEDEVRKAVKSGGGEGHDSRLLQNLKRESERATAELTARVHSLETQLKQAKEDAKRAAASAVSGADYQTLKKANDTLQREHARVLKRVEELQDELHGRDSRIQKIEMELGEKNGVLAENERKLKEAVQVRERALQQSRESERSFARLLTDSNKRDIEYKAKIDALKKNLAISPDQTERFYSDQNAVYQILRRELESVTKTIEGERHYLENLKKLEAERLKELEKHRQTLQNHLGKSPAEMTSRVSREQVADPNAVRLRSELDNLKLAHQRTLHLFEERERDLNHKLKVLQADYTKLMDQLLEKEHESESLLNISEKLAATQHELNETRKSYEAERRQFVANNNALAARVVELEGGVAKGARPEEIQSSEARGVKLASWMTFKK